MLITREPRLRLLLAAARAVVASPQFCANACWIDHFDEWHQRLVGWEREPDPVLGTSEAYHVSFTTVFGALPDCAHEGVLC
jgi:hypothetical protein